MTVVGVCSARDHTVTLHLISSDLICLTVQLQGDVGIRQHNNKFIKRVKSVENYWCGFINCAVEMND